MPRILELGTLSRSHASHLAFRMLDAGQDEPLEYTAAALGLILQTLTEVKNLSPQDIMAAAHNMLRATGLEDDNYVTALRTYIRDEVPSQ